MTTIAEPPASPRPQRSGVLPSIGVWWPMLERPLKREILENPSAPLRRAVVRRIFDLCEIDLPVPRFPVRLTGNERAYLAGWTHTVDWE